jgi:ribosomal protein S18 acetylase RimI-like enzyme
MDLRLRRASAQDDPFLFQLYASTRVEELALVNWDAAQEQSFLQMQFDAQRRSYGHEFPGALCQIVLHDDASAGRLVVDHSEERILIVDIALLPEYRSTGIGTNLIRALQREAEESGRPLVLYVEGFNPALLLYERLGFTKIAQDGLYWRMEWQHNGRKESGSEEAGKGKGV